MRSKESDSVQGGIAVLPAMTRRGEGGERESARARERERDREKERGGRGRERKRWERKKGYFFMRRFEKKERLFHPGHSLCSPEENRHINEEGREGIRQGRGKERKW
jgi:hypothetical protein